MSNNVENSKGNQSDDPKGRPPKDENDLNNLNKSHGGRRLNSGPKKGAKYAKTVAKELAREILRERVTRELDPLLDAQIANAMGIDHFFLRDPVTKQFRRITDPDEIETALNSGDKDSYYRIFTKDPSVPAFIDLMNRALDRPAEQMKVTGTNDGPVVFKWQDMDERIAAGRKRLAAGNRDLKGSAPD